nr:Casein kinase (serine/threonine/tyrosine protein kinase) [Ipomoea batatas]
MHNNTLAPEFQEYANSRSSTDLLLNPFQFQVSIGPPFKMRLGFPKDDLESSTGQSLDGSFRKPGSVTSFHTTSSTSGKFVPTSKRAYKVLKDYAAKLVDIDLFTEILEEWVQENLYPDNGNCEQSFSSPFLIDELRALDYALEGILFQQLFRMPCSPYSCDNLKEDEYLALEDFLHTIADGLWHTFWHKSKPMPYFVSCPRYPGSKFYTLEKALSRGRLAGLSGAALMSRTRDTPHVHWDDVVEFALFKTDILMGNGLGFSTTVICEALFYGIHILLSRSLSRYNSVDGDSVFILVLDSKFGGVVKLGGDLGNLEVDLINPYQSMAEWMKCHAEISISPVDRIWNKLGNVNWGDLGTLQLILATFYSICQWNGPPRKSIASLAADHSLRLQKRRIECRLIENESALVPYENTSDHHGEIVELEHHHKLKPRKQGSRLGLKQGEIVLLEDQNLGQKQFQVHEPLAEDYSCSYIGIALDCPAESLTLHFGAHPSRLEPSWEDMSLWYHVQRQTKVLNIFREHGISSKNLLEIVASGKMMHSGPCEKPSQKGCCDHPWCGTPVLVTYPVGEPLSSVITRDGPFSSQEAIRCCHDCLAALRSAKTANIQHGDICPEHIIRVASSSSSSNHSYVLVSWGRAVLEERDSPAMNLQFSSAHALQHGKLCPSSDTESLVYLIYFICGGTMPQQDSIESALQWRQRSWAKRVIQHRLGEVSALLKAFADYIDSLCGTPYPVDYDVWLRRLNHGSADRGKRIEDDVVGTEDMGDYSGRNSS